MIHIAIMNSRLGLIDKILSGEKTIESRWYKNKIAPWNKVNVGDIIYFKESGGMVRAKAIVTKVLQFADLDITKIGKLVNKYGKEINIQNWDYETWGQGKKYCILMWLKDAKAVEPFKVDKTGFGAGAAWMCLDKFPYKPFD